MKKILSVLLVAVMVLAMVPFTASAAANWTTIADSANAYSNLDYVSSADYGDILLTVGGGNGTDVSVSMAKGSKTHVTFFGWFALNTKDISAYGYSINGASVVYDASFKGAGVGVEQTYSARYYTQVPVSGLSEGTHKLYNYVKLADGSEYIVGTINLTLTATAVAGETIPGLYTGDLSALNMDFQDSAFTNGFDVTTSGNPLRSKWTPVLAGAGTPVIAVDGSNKYVQLNGFFELTPDYRWNAPYEFSVDVKGYAGNAAGIFINNANDSNQANSADMDTFFALYEAPFAGTDAYSGQTGIFLRLVNATTIEIVVYTFDEANTNWDSYTGKISTTVTVPSLDSFQTINVKDDNQGKITIAVAGNVVATIKYSNDGVYNNFACGAWGDFSERYYKTVGIYDAAGALVASTDKALLSYYKRVGFATRACSFAIDNIKLSAYTAPATSLAVSIPTDIVAAPGAKITVPVVLTGDASIVFANGTVKYNSALTYTGYSIGNVFTSFDSSSKIAKSTNGEVDIVVMDGAFEERVANGTLIKLNFTVPANAANGTVYTFEYVPSAIGDAFLDMNETEYLPTSVTAGKATVVVEESDAPDAITVIGGSTYVVDETIGAIVAKPTSNVSLPLSEFKAQIETDATYYRVVNASGAVQTGANVRITAKLSVQLLDASGAVVKTYKIIVVGDPSGDGRIAAGDVNTINGYVKNSRNYPSGSAEFYAANANGDKRLSALDVNALKKFMASSAW